jgi:hypothetical protein
VKQFLACLDHATTTPGATTTDLSTDCAAGVVRPAVLGDQFRVRVDVTNVSEPAPTWDLCVSAHGE